MRKPTFREAMDLMNQQKLCGYIRNYLVTQDLRLIRGYCSLRSFECKNTLPMTRCPEYMERLRHVD